MSADPSLAELLAEIESRPCEIQEYNRPALTCQARWVCCSLVSSWCDRCLLAVAARALRDQQTQLQEARAQAEDWQLAADDVVCAVEVVLDTAESQLTSLRTKLKDAKIDAEDADNVRERLATLLSLTATALKGEPEPLHLHDWSDLPKRVEVLIRELAEARRALDEATDT